MTVLTMVIVLLSGVELNAQGLMRGEASDSQGLMRGESTEIATSPNNGQDTEMNASLDRWEMPLETSVGLGSSAQSAEVAETINYLNNDQFQADLNVNALSVIQDDELQYEVRNLIRENQKLKAKVEEQQELKNKIAQLERTIQDMEEGWEIIKQ